VYLHVQLLFGVHFWGHLGISVRLDLMWLFLVRVRVAYLVFLGGCSFCLLLFVPRDGSHDIMDVAGTALTGFYPFCMSSLANSPEISWHLKKNNLASFLMFLPCVTRGS
jgi:hypothetical protein